MKTIMQVLLPHFCGIKLFLRKTLKITGSQLLNHLQIKNATLN